jgi:predicted TIM-barrel fold metal-dependent hydrolase
MSDAVNLDWLVSVDDHVLEPGDLWQKRVPARYRDVAPRIVSDDDGGEFWQYEDRRVQTLGTSANAGRTKDEVSPAPIRYADMRPGCADPVARVADMDEAGILAAVLFPTFPRFCGQVFYEAKDHELGLICVKAWNDWMIDEWCAAVPGRFIPQMIVPLWDPKEGAREIERCAAKGARGVLFTENPVPLGLPTLHDEGRYWDPLWAAVQDTELVVSIHQGSSSHRLRRSEDTPELAVNAWAIGTQAAGAMLDWLLGPVFHRYPGVKVALSEGGVGWMSYFVQRAQQVVDTHGVWLADGNLKVDMVNTKLEHHGPKPEVDPRKLDVWQLFRDHIYGCFIDDLTGIATLPLIGTDNVMIETDYPHSDSTWPTSIDYAHVQLAGLDDDTKYKILRGNAEKLYRFVPAEVQSTRFHASAVLA